MITPRQTNQEIAAEIGRRIQRYRLSALTPAPTQRVIAAKAGIAEPTIKRLEGGGNATILTMIAVLRELGLLGNLDLLVPENLEPSPLEVLRQTPTPRQRAPRVRKARAPRGRR